jgi:hypothetical protein
LEVRVRGKGRWKMRGSLHISTFDPMHEVPEVCKVCGSNPPVFFYEWLPYGEESAPENTEGFCCADCGAKLLKKLERLEAREWAEEEVALEADGSDVTDFREHRLAAFAKTETN